MQPGSRRVRTAGLALLGVAVVAIGLGVFALTSNGSSPAAQGRPPVVGSSTTNPPPTTSHQPKPRPTTTRPKPTTTQAPTTTPKPGPPTTTIAPPPPRTTGTPSVKQTVPVRVYNNGTIKDLAARAAAEFRADGFDVVQVGNYSQGVIPTSTVYFTSAPGEKQVATDLGHDFSMRVLPRFPGIAFASPGVIVIVTNDFQFGK